MVFFFILLGFMLGVRLLADQLVPKPRELCKIHKWTYKNVNTETEYMVCGRCGMLPGGDYEEGGQR